MGFTDSVMKPVEIRYKGIYDYEGLYQLIRKWFDEHNYDFMENKYKDKVGGPFGNEVELKMKPELKVTEFIKYHITVETHFWDVKEFEAEFQGEKKKVTDGRFWIKLSASIEFDYTGRFHGKWKTWLEFLVTKVLRRYYEIKYYDQLKYDVYGLQKQMKEHLKMETKYNAY